MGSPVPGSPRLSADPTPDVLDPADSCPASRSVLADWLALQRALGLNPQKAAELLRRHGHPAGVLAACGLSMGFDRNAEIAALLRAGAVAVPLDSAAYPVRLASLSDPAPLLLVRGDVGALSELSVAIVGARAATVYGKQIARDLAADLAREGVVIVSGLARGIDAEAHRGALEAGGRTVAVQACGIDRIYPCLLYPSEAADDLSRLGCVGPLSV